MNKNTLRSLGIGFLSAGVLSGAFAIFVQGQTPVEGLKVNSLLNSANETQISQYEEQVSSLEAERDSLKESLSSVSSQDNSSLEDEITSLKETNESLRAQLDTNNSDDTDESTSETEAEAESTTEESAEVAQAQPTTEGSFNIGSGEASADIASRLEAEGYIDSAVDFQNLLDQWDLNSVIQAGDFDINSDMSIHDIASIITEGAYYYY